MSHATYHKQHKGPNFDVVVTIRYHGLKATQYFTKFTEQSLSTLRSDLLALKIPHPKRENIVLVTHGCVEFSWFDIEDQGILHKNLIQKLTPRDPEQRNALRQLLEELSITSATFKTIPIVHTKKRQNPYTTSSTEGPRKRQSIDYKPPDKEQAAVSFIEDTIAGLQTTVPKSEPVEPTLPPTPGPSVKLTRRTQHEPASVAPSTSALPADLSPTQILSRELWDLRRQLSAGLSRERTIIQDLKTLEPTLDLPTPMINGLPDTGELKFVRSQLDLVTQELVTERKLRRQAEDALDDLKREINDPFILPQLMEALSMVSKMTSEVVP